uniref:Pyroglutamyl-peptidase I n=1 Tax=Aureoumbra lagunensis TaxID=44058 RepID=A0A7S3JRC4_9STRA|mmetsp:Transcript_21135/g.26305  ORF Transcript_21135/g.26305 Transcript_21135/m.26305 type:complete len:349 (-) Transcript_21135:977-2023(-)
MDTGYVSTSELDRDRRGEEEKNNRKESRIMIVSFLFGFFILSVVMFLCIKVSAKEPKYKIINGHIVGPPPPPQECGILEKEKRMVLVTGFERFNNILVNPSLVAAMSLNGTCGPHYCIESHILSVDSNGAKWPASRLHKYIAVLHLGFEDVAKGLKIEIMAKNLLGSTSNPSWGFDDPCTKESAAIENGPCLQVTTAPLDRLILPSTNETNEVWSRDAGAFYCNELYFRSLHTVRSRQLLVPSPSSSCLLLSQQLLDNDSLTRASDHHLHFAQALIPVLFVHLPDTNIMDNDLVLPLLHRLIYILADPPLTTVHPPPSTQTFKDIHYSFHDQGDNDDIGEVQDLDNPL